MGVGFPLNNQQAIPTGYAHITPSAGHGVYYVGGSPSFTLSTSGATSYAVRDYFGNVVSSGSVSGTTVTPTAPAGGWLPGWYRLYLTGTTNDSVYGYALGSTNFVVLRNDSRFHGFTANSGQADSSDPQSKGSLGMGTHRLFIDHADAPTTGTGSIAQAQSNIALYKTYWNVPSGDADYDSVRTRLLWLQFPNGTTDSVTIGSLVVYCKDGTVDGSTVSVASAAGTSSGNKITVTSGATTETYDNLASADVAVTALAASAFVRGFGSGSLTTLSSTTIGNAKFNGVKQVVSTLYPDVTRYEGPENEPRMDRTETAHKMKLFQAAVHAGNASAKAIGPNPVSLGGIGSSTEPFFAAGGGAYCDEISVHAYGSQVNGDINSGRSTWNAFFALLAKYGLQSKPIWQTESTQVMTNIYGVYHPRRGRVPMLQTLLLEQLGIPRERNTIWYDVSHGFWSFPAWWQETDGSFAPYAVLYRVLAEETFGKNHTSALSFGTVGDKVFLGSIYGTSAAGSVAVIQAQSAMPTANGGTGPTVTLNVAGTTSALTVIDGLGNSSTVTIDANGHATIPVAEIPTYVRLPVGVTVTVHHCNDWPSNTGGWISSAVSPFVTPAGAASNIIAINDGQMLNGYSGTNTTDGWAQGSTVPDTATMTWASGTRVDRLLIWGGVWQSMSALIDFDVQTSVDGTTWVTQATVTRPTPSSFVHGADYIGSGCQRETYWDEQWIHDVKLPAPVSCKGVRLVVRATSYGGEPDAACVTAGGQGNNVQAISIQEVAVLCDANANGTGSAGAGPYGARI